MLTNECTLISCPEILTMDEGKPTAEAVCISEGKILAVGTLEELRALAPRHRRKEIHLEEGVLLPGFIDSHTHLEMESAGTVTADSFASGTAAALAGGIPF